MKRLIQYMLATLLTLGLSCNRNDNPCGDDTKGQALPFFRLKNMIAIASKITDTTGSAGSKSLIVQKMTSADTITHNEFVIKLEGLPEYYAFHSLPLFSCMPSLACGTPPVPSGVSKEKPDSIFISSDSSFDALHPAGSSLNDLFKDVAKLSNAMTIAQLYTSNVQETYNLALMAKPQPKQMKFYVYFRQNNGVSFSTSTQVVLFR